MQGFIKLHRKIFEWDWYKDRNTKCLFIHLLLKANREDKESYGVMIKRGQVITGRRKLAEETGLSEREVRTSLSRLQTTSELTTKTTNKYSIITLLNYDKYQSKGSGERPAERPTKRQQTTTKQEVKKKEEKEIVENGIPYNEIVLFLNEKTGKAFRTKTAATRRVIKARWSEGFTFDDFKKVISIKSDEWNNDPKMSKHLNPDTLFGNKFDKYLNQESSSGGNWS